VITPSRRRALIVATGKYDDPKLRRLRAPAADAQQLAEVLRDPAIGDFDVEIAEDCDERDLRRRIARFFHASGRDDVLLLHVSGHGIKDARGSLFLAAADTELDLLDATAISAAWLNEQMTQSPSRRKLLLLDCCFSGKFPFGMTPRGGEGMEVERRMQGRGRAVITASNSMEYAYEGEQLSGQGEPSYFSAAVVEALKTGEADRDQDHWISVDELYDYVYDRVKERSPNQTPSKQIALEGPLYVARSRYRRAVEPAVLDRQLLDLIEHPYSGARLGAIEELARLLKASNPSVALAAREALEQMRDDDSRNVGERANAVLDEARIGEVPESAPVDDLHERAQRTLEQQRQQERERLQRERDQQEQLQSEQQQQRERDQLSGVQRILPIGSLPVGPPSKGIMVSLGLAVVAAMVVAISLSGQGPEKNSARPSVPSGDLSPSKKAATKILPVQGASSVSLSVGSKNFTEQHILGEIYTQALRAAGYKVKKDLGLGSEVIAYKALRQGDVDAYPEYTGTSLTSFFGVKTRDVPRDPEQAYEDSKAAYAKVGITSLAPTPFENTYRMAVTKKKAAELGNPTKISDLKGKAQDMVVNGFPACRQRVDCLIGVERSYGLKFKRFLPGENKFQILDNGDADIAFVFTTDGELASGKYVVLDDDKHVFPPYNISFTMRDSAAKKLGKPGQNVVADVQEYMTEEIMQELNARVDINQEEPATVAADYLKKFGFVPSSS
jgi:glycine betaine/choline ABC-type transport system substrate-binding protein